ncbi:unnamed protein product [Protopolystoma xenopodis]|uniref:Uncharacterized protein n=1 Tax=Protopolystoma xenopodis TaxID=117903 RepID=A0A3S5AXR7_9PLAT|nr:unnamed protein product [Protopolystoma xenopodis]
MVDDSDFYVNDASGNVLSQRSAVANHHGKGRRTSFFGIPDLGILPEVRSSAEIFGQIMDPNCLLSGLPICGILGDQQAALVGHTWPKSSTVDKFHSESSPTKSSGTA